MEQDDWFSNVENLKPIRGGRRAGTLNSIVKNSFHVTNKQAEDKFRNDWELAKESDDPLEILWKYSIWFDEHFPSGKPQLYYPMLYKICTNYGNDERYQHDERLLKFWIMLAENFPERGLAVFDFAYNRGSCNTYAKFYVRWAELFDHLGNSHKARETLEFGLKNRATPITVIHEAQSKLEMRLMRDSLRQQKMKMNESNGDEQDMNYDEDNFMPSVQRKNLGKLVGVGEKLEAPMFRIAVSDPGTLRIPQTHVNASFEVYEDEPEPSQRPIPLRTVERIEDEFANDPDYQALFGFFQKSRVDIHLNISENIRKTNHLGLSDLAPLPTDNDDFEVFVDGEEQDSQKSSQQSTLGEKKSQGNKPRLCQRKEVRNNEKSPEEIYATIVANLRSL